MHEMLLRQLPPPSAIGVGRANLLTAIAFGACHLAMEPGLWAALTVLPALAIGHLYERTRRLWPCVLLHLAFNGVWLLHAAATHAP